MNWVEPLNYAVFLATRMAGSAFRSLEAVGLDEELAL